MRLSKVMNLLMMIGLVFASKAHADVTLWCPVGNQQSWILVFNKRLEEFEKADRVHIALRRAYLNNASRVDWLYGREFELSKLQRDQNGLAASLVGGGKIELFKNKSPLGTGWTWYGRIELPEQGAVPVEACDLSDPEIGMTARN